MEAPARETGSFSRVVAPLLPLHHLNSGFRHRVKLGSYLGGATRMMLQPWRCLIPFVGFQICRSEPLVGNYKVLFRLQLLKVDRKENISIYNGKQLHSENMRLISEGMKIMVFKGGCPPLFITKSDFDFIQSKFLLCGR